MCETRSAMFARTQNAHAQTALKKVNKINVLECDMYMSKIV